MANNKPFIVKSGLVPQTHNDQDLGHATSKFANAHISNLVGAVQIDSAYTLPTADGTAEQVIKTDGAGNLSFTTISTNFLGLTDVTPNSFTGQAGKVVQVNTAENAVEFADLAAVTFSDAAPSTPQSGDLWFDSGTNAELFIWTGTEWISTTGGDQAAFTMRDFTGDNTTTVFSTGVGSNVSAFVYVNGVLLKETSDYSFANGDVTFVTAPALNDVIQVMLHGQAEYMTLGTLGGNTDDITEGTTNLYYTDARVQTKLGNISGHILPDTNDTYDIGSASNKIRDLYLGSNTLHIGDADITSTGTKVELPTGSTIGGAEAPQVNLAIAPETLEIQVDAPDMGQDTMWKWTWEQSTLPYARRTITNSNELQVPLYKEGTYVVNNFAAYDIHGSMTQTHSLYLKWIDGAGTDNLVSWATSAGPISDTHPDINSGNATDVQRITVSVPATITPPTLNNPSVAYTVTNNSAGAYTFSGSAKGDNPNIGPIYRGGTYTFNVSATGHPFYLTTDNGTNFSAGQYFGEYTTGVTGSRSDSGSVTFTVPANAPDTLYYQCGNHSAMRGEITVKDLALETNINGNYVIYFQHTQEGHRTPVELRPIPSLVNQMCLVYDNTTNRFVPQDLATYVENTPSFENKIREVAGTAELVVEDGSAVIAKVNVYDDSTYLPLTGNNAGDQAFATDTDILYIWDGSAWQQAGAANSDDLTEGTTNLFFTDARADARIAAATTADLTEGSNLYFTNERVDDRVAALVVGGNNITATYDDAAGTLTLDGQPGYTDTDVGAYLSNNGYDTATNIIASITDSAPTTLDTLNELAAALGDDPNFATTITNSIATKLAIADFTSTADTWIATKSTSDLSEGTNLYYTDARADARIAAANTDDLSEGSTNLYFTDARADARIALQVGANLDLSSKSTSDLAEGTNLYYTDARADARITKSVIDGLNVDADTLDGLDSLQFLRSDTADTMSGNLTLYGNMLLTYPTPYVSTGVDNQNLRIANNANNSSSGNSINMFGETQGGVWEGDIHYVASGVGSSGGHKFWNWNGSGWDHQLNLTSDGKLGLGDNAGNYFTPTNKLHIKDGSIRLQASQQTTGDHSQSVGIRWSQESDSEVAYIKVDRPSWAYAPSDMKFAVRDTTNAAVEKLELKNDGALHNLAGGFFSGYTSASNTDGQLNSPFRLDYDRSSYMFSVANNPATWGLFWAGNSGARYGTNGNGGPGDIWSNSSNPNEFVFVGSDNTKWSVNGNNGNTWQGGTLTAVGDIVSGGDVITNSDERLKSDIRTIDNPRQLIAGLSGKLYTKDDKENQIGFIAQQVEEVLPQLVHTANDEMGTKSVNYQGVIALLVEAVKDLQQQVDELKGNK